MQFTSIIIVALLAVSTSTVTADQKSYNLRSGRKLQEETELNLRDLGACNSPISIQAGDTCSSLRNTCGGWASLSCVWARQTCTEENSKLIAGDSCTLSMCDFPITIQSSDTCEDIVDTCGGVELGLECDLQGATYETCTSFESHLTVGASCKPLTACKVVNGEEDLHADEYLCGGCGEQYTCCEHPGDAKHPGMYYYCN